MRNRRTFFSSLVGAAALMTGVSEAVPFASADRAGMPRAAVIPGKPPVLDFGDGVRVPCNKEAFLTLWEGNTYWLVFGAGQSSFALQANGIAVANAKAAMKLLLMTLAFAPARLEHGQSGGWHLRSNDIRDFVHGDIELPGNPFWPVNDVRGTFGNGWVPVAMSGGQTLVPGWTKVDAFAAYVILKREMSLEDVRLRAHVMPS